MRRTFRLLALGVLIAISVIVAFLVALAPTMPLAPELRGRFSEDSIEVDGRKRRYELYEPPNWAPGGPLVFSIHGSGLDPATQREWVGARFAELADREGFLVAYPEGWRLEWNGCRGPGVTEADRQELDDVGFHLEILKRLSASHGVDPDRVVAAGFSNGGQMAYRLGSDAPERFAAVAAMVANVPRPLNSKCNEPKGPIPVLIMNGVTDPIVPFEGGVASLFGLSPRGEVRSALASAEFWRDINGDPPPTGTGWIEDREPTDGSRIEYHRFGAGRSEVLLYAVHGGGHTIPGGVALGSPRLFGRFFGVANRDAHGIDLIWSFFQRHLNPPKVAP